MAVTVLLVEADPDLRRVIAASLEQHDWNVLQAESAATAAMMLEVESPDVLVLELDLPLEENGKLIDDFRKRKAMKEPCPVLLTTSRRPESEWRRKHHPDAVVYKPYDVRLLQSRIRTLLEEISSETD